MAVAFSHRRDDAGRTVAHGVFPTALLCFPKPGPADLKPWVEGILKPLQQRLMNGAIAAQRAIDSPTAYQRV